MENIKVIKRDLILVTTKQDSVSYLLILDLDSKENKWVEFKLINVVLSIDRSEDELAILYVDGEIEIYTIKDQKVILVDTRKIFNFSTFLAKHREKQKIPIKTKIATQLANWKTILLSKIENWGIFKKVHKQASFVAVKFHLFGTDSYGNLIDEVPWKDTPGQVWWGKDKFIIPNISNTRSSSSQKNKPVKWATFYLNTGSKEGKIQERERWYVILDDSGQLWFDEDGKFANEDSYIYMPNNELQNINNTYSDCHISLLFSKKNHQMVLLEKKDTNRFSYLLPNGKDLRILPLTDTDIEGVMKINYADSERLVLVKKNPLDDPNGNLTLYLIKD